MTAYWNSHLSSGPNPITINCHPRPLHQDRLLARDDTSHDYRSVNWKSFLAGGDEPPTLDFSRSEASFRSKSRPEDIKIQSYWEIDSMFARVNTLAVHFHGLTVNYRSSFLRSITQNPRITIGGIKPHKVKHMIFGQGIGEVGNSIFTCILFPELPINGKQSAHLTEAQSAEWFDRVLLPAMRKTCSHNILQHRPRSYRDATSKANVKKEVYLHTFSQPMENRYALPPQVFR